MVDGSGRDDAWGASVSTRHTMLLVAIAGVVTALVLVTGSGASTVLWADPTDETGSTTWVSGSIADDGAPGTAPLPTESLEGAAETPTGNASAVATGGDSVTSRNGSPFAEAGVESPARQLEDTRRAKAFERISDNGTLDALRNGSFLVQPGYEYAPERDVVTLQTWHHKRVEGSWRTNLTVTYDEGYVARAAVDPASGNITGFALSEREPAVVTRNYTAAESDAVEVALSNATVRDRLADADYYVSMVRNEVTYPSASCDLQSCYLVVLKRTSNSAHLTVHVSASGDRVVGIMDQHWTRSPGSPPSVNVSAFPDLDTSRSPAANVSRPGANASEPASHAPVTRGHWNVDYAVTEDDGIRLRDVRYRGQTILGPGTRLLRGARVPHIHVSYDEEVEEYGGDGGHHHHTHIFDQLKTPAHGPHVHEFGGGFSIHARYYLGCEADEWPTVGCYKYGQTWRFYDNGTFAPRLTIFGPGFMESAGPPTYDTVMRFDSAVGPTANDTVGAYGADGWSAVEQEDNVPADPPTADRGRKWSVRDATTNTAAYARPYGPDGADFWVLRSQAPDDHHPDELDDDERTANRDVVAYYVGHRDSCAPADPCRVGPTWNASDLTRLDMVMTVACTGPAQPAGVAESLSCRGGPPAPGLNTAETSRERTDARSKSDG